MEDTTESADDIIATVTTGVQKARARRASLVKSAEEFTTRNDAEIAKLDKVLTSIAETAAPKPKPPPTKPVPSPVAPPPPKKVAAKAVPKGPVKAAAPKPAPKPAPKAAKVAGAPKGKPGRKPSADSRTAKALAFAIDNNDASTAEIGAHLGIDNVRASQVVNQLKTQGKLASRGERGAMRHYAPNGASA